MLENITIHFLVNENRIAFLKVMTWCYSNYYQKIGELNFIENILVLLQQ